MARTDKSAAIAELKEKFENSSAILLTEYRGLTVAAMQTLRRSLGADAEYKVAKNTLTAIAAKQAGVDPRGVVDAIRGGLAGSKVLEQKAEKMLADEFAPGFRINLHIKDLNNALETGHAVGASLPLTAAVREMMTAIANDGHLLHDHSSLLAFYERLAGTALAG